jgi:single-stranded DNA-binding protein
MAKDRNTLKIEGVLADDPQVQTFNSGSKKTRFTLEVRDEYKDKETKQYFVVEAWAKAADEFARHKTGDHVQFEGQVAQSNYKKKNGEQVNEFLLKALRYGWKVWNQEGQNRNNGPSRFEESDEAF